MKILEIVSTPAQSRMIKVLHVTQKRHVPKIMRDGLLPRLGAGSLFLIPMNGMVKYLPEKFFDTEIDARLTRRHRLHD